MSHDHVRRRQAIPLQQAAQEAPSLASLMARMRDSSDRLAAVLPLIPPMLRPAIQAGPVEDGQWCLLVTGNAAAAKLRQLLPALQACLRQRGWQADGIRIKVLLGPR